MKRALSKKVHAWDDRSWWVNRCQEMVSWHIALKIGLWTLLKPTWSCVSVFLLSCSNSDVSRFLQVMYHVHLPRQTLAPTLEHLRRKQDTHDQMRSIRVHRQSLKAICYDPISWHLSTHQERSSQTTPGHRISWSRRGCTGKISLLYKSKFWGGTLK